MSQRTNPEAQLQTEIPAHQRPVVLKSCERKYYWAKWVLRGPANDPDSPVKELQVQFFLSPLVRTLDRNSLDQYWSELTSIFPNLCAETMSNFFRVAPPTITLKHIDLRNHENKSPTAVSWHMRRLEATRAHMDVKHTVERFFDELDLMLGKKMDPLFPPGAS